MRILSWSLLALLALPLTVGACSCEGVPDDPPVEVDPVGTLRVVHNGTTATLVVTGLRAPLRMFQADVAVSGGNASAIAPVLDHDLLEGGFADGPRAAFTAVVADSRRLPINNGNIATITVDDGARLSLSKAIAVDANGVRQTLATEASE